MKRLVAALMPISCLFFGSAAQAISVSDSSDGAYLAGSILGSGITISNVSYTGASGASGTFTDGSAVGIDSGVVMSSGSASGAIGPNDVTGYSVNNGFAGDSDLDTLIPGYTTNDATVLSFDFEFDGGAGGDLYFDIVFGSEEYNEYVGQFNDVFGLFLDGANIATIPGGDVISINSINNGSNSAYYVDNELGAIDTQMDGFTTLISIQALGLSAGTHTMKFAIADANDYALDSWLLVKAGSFSSEPSPVPLPAAVWLLGSGIIGLLGFSRRKTTA